MEWVKINDKLPERDQTVLVYKIIDMGGYYKDKIYIATYAKLHNSTDYYFIIEDNEINGNNNRLIKEFSHWMPLPNTPVSQF